MRQYIPIWKRISLLRKECSSYFKFFKQINKEQRDIVFYSRQAQYMAFFEGLINALVHEHGARLCYITSDPRDPILQTNSTNLISFYFNTLFPFVLPFLNAKVVVLTMPDLNQFHIRRSIHDTDHVYVFHSMMSTHMIYRLGAFDHYDTIFCVGPYHLEEIRRTEDVYDLQPKRLLEVGYYRVEKIYHDHQRYLNDSTLEENRRNCILIAPGWHDSNIIEVCARELIATLLKSEYDVILRPHPMTIAKKPEQLLALENEFGSDQGFHLDIESATEKTLHKADVLISDWSGVALEYAFGTERPVLFIDLPRKVHNPEYEKIDVVPIEISLREEIGQVISIEDIPNASLIVSNFLTNRKLYKDKIVNARKRNVYNFGKSSEIGANYIMDIYHGRLKGESIE
jgi:YidC/Oxa1 family membrane protein insertase